MNTCQTYPSKTVQSESETAREAITRPQYHSQQDENGATVQIALPGVRKEDVKLTLHESNLKIEAHRGEDVPESWKTHRSGARSRQYGLQLRLTSRLDGTQTTASYDSGVLTLQVPVREEAKPREIAVL